MPLQCTLTISKIFVQLCVIESIRSPISSIGMDGSGPK